MRGGHQSHQASVRRIPLMVAGASLQVLTVPQRTDPGYIRPHVCPMKCSQHLPPRPPEKSRLGSQAPVEPPGGLVLSPSPSLCAFPTSGCLGQLGWCVQRCSWATALPSPQGRERASGPMGWAC